MNQLNQYTSIRPATEKLLSWQGSQRTRSREEMVSQLGFGLLKLVVVAVLIVVTLLTTS